jgi:hypothetical protein
LNRVREKKSPVKENVLLKTENSTIVYEDFSGWQEGTPLKFVMPVYSAP